MQKLFIIYSHTVEQYKQCRLSVWANWAVARGLTTLGGLKRNSEFGKEITWSLSTARIENS